MPFYAVANGKTIGIFLHWNDCNNSVKGYKNALYKKFDTKEEADNFIRVNKNMNIQKDNNINNHKIEPNQLVPVSMPLSNLSFPSQECTLGTCAYSADKLNNKWCNPDYYVYTDGACSNNGKENALAGIGIFFGINDNRNISKKIEGKQTNNRAELSAIIETYYIIENDVLNGKKITIVSDSEYAIKCVSSYGEKCYKKDWKLDIPNKDLVKIAYEIYKDKLNVQFIHIKAHTNNTDIHSFGNDNADKLANMAICLENCPYNTIKMRKSGGYK